MLDGWYCRSIANMQAEADGQREPAQPEENQDSNSSDSDSGLSEPDQEYYRTQNNALKRKLKYLIYENECFQDELRIIQRKMLKLCRERNFLLERLFQYEKPEKSSSESDDTDSSDDGEVTRNENPRRRRADPSGSGHSGSNLSNMKGQNVIKRKRPPAKKPTSASVPYHNISNTKAHQSSTSDGHMTPEEVERHLQSRQSYLELLPERAPPTVPTEMFSNDPSLDSESNDLLETSPCNVADDWVE